MDRRGDRLSRLAVPGRRDDFLDDYSLGFSRRVVPITGAAV